MRGLIGQNQIGFNMITPESIPYRPLDYVLISTIKVHYVPQRARGDGTSALIMQHAMTESLDKHVVYIRDRELKSYDLKLRHDLQLGGHIYDEQRFQFFDFHLLNRDLGYNLISLIRGRPDHEVMVIMDHHAFEKFHRYQMAKHFGSGRGSGKTLAMSDLAAKMRNQNIGIDGLLHQEYRNSHPEIVNEWGEVQQSHFDELRSYAASRPEEFRRLYEGVFIPSDAPSSDWKTLSLEGEKHAAEYWIKKVSKYSE